jgi:hypothetical protein
LIEEICMLDQMSGGRLDIGFGRGASPIEAAIYGNDPAKAEAMYVEGLELIMRGLTHKTLDFHGECFSFDDVPMLCAGCHGPTYRDWSKGIHGRTNGYWDTGRGVIRRLLCTQCHAPHAPAFAPMSLLPGPHTLRLEPDRRPAHEEQNRENPLRRGVQPSSGSAGDGHGSSQGGVR